MLSADLTDIHRRNNRNDAEFLVRMMALDDIAEDWVPDDE